MRYAVVIEKTERNYGGYVPDLPGCVATGASVQETMTNLREAIRLHVAGMIEDGEPVPDPSTLVDYLHTELLPPDDIGPLTTGGSSKATGPVVGNLKGNVGLTSAQFKGRMPRRVRG
jgi:predicted RNase H-like HicB family nuclease